MGGKAGTTRAGNASVSTCLTHVLHGLHGLHVLHMFMRISKHMSAHIHTSCPLPLAFWDHIVKIAQQVPGPPPGPPPLTVPPPPPLSTVPGPSGPPPGPPPHVSVEQLLQKKALTPEVHSVVMSSVPWGSSSSSVPCYSSVRLWLVCTGCVQSEAARSRRARTVSWHPKP